jgi:23S rRNA pseudoU1915 N3-methylase RlmH
MHKFKLVFTLIVLVSAGCGSAPQTEATETETAPAKFVSVPELKELMATKVELAAEAIWNAALDESAPKTDADWKKLEEAAAALAENGKSLMTSNLAKDQGKWKEESQKLIDIAEVSRKAIAEKNRDALVDAGNKMNDAVCVSCHMIYFNPTE